MPLRATTWGLAPISAWGRTRFRPRAPDAAPAPILRPMRRRDLLTQVLLVNLLLIVAAVVTAVIAANPDAELLDRRSRRSSSGSRSR